MTQHKFHREARLEYIAALLLLEEQRIGYGEKFEADVETVLKRIEAFPRSAPLLAGFPSEIEARAFPLKTFRYSLMVVLEGDTAVVYAVAHQHRMPGYWTRRIT